MSLKTGAKFYRRTDVKLTLWYILTFMVSVVIISGFLYMRVKHQLVKEVDRFILDETKELADILMRSPNQNEALKNFERHVGARTLYPMYFQILTKDGNMIYASEKYRAIGYRLDKKVLVNAKEGRVTREYRRPYNRKRPLRIISSSFSTDGRSGHIIQMGTHLKFVRKELSNFKRNTLAAFPIILVLGSLGGWVLARRSLSPIRYIASKAQRITSNNLNERLTVRGTNDEMDDLIRTINEMIARLESSFKRISEFTADASHELKTPLCALRGEAEVLLSRGRAPEEYQEGLAHFIERFDHLNRMINDLILLSKFDSSQLELEMTSLRLDLLVQDIGNLFKILAEQKGIELQMGKLQEITIMGDKVRLQQLLTNLIDNAIKYTPEGSIRITVEKDEENAVVRVGDTGIGIPREEQEKIFKRFYRVDKSRSKEGGGVGLGLSIAEWIAKAHHGRIEVESELNKGSVFMVYLPLK